MAKDLTAKALDALKPGAARREIPDGHTRGLFYVLQPSGAASWAFRYRFAGKPKKLTLGPSALDLKTARQMASEAAQALARGDDPAEAKKESKIAARAAAEERKRAAAPARDLIETVASTFVERFAKKNTREKTWKETSRLLTREVVEAWRGRPLSAIKRSDVHDLLDKIVDRGAPIVANRTLAVLRQLCGWAVDRGIIDASPCDKVRAPAPETARDRVLSEDEIRAAWAAFDGVGWPFGQLAKLLLLTGARREEVASARWTEFDLEVRTWTIPKERAKNKTAHEVPLSEAAMRIVETLPSVHGRGRSPGFLFTTNGEGAVSGFSAAKAGLDRAVLAALRKAAGERGEDPDNVAPPPRWTLHDLRRTAASGMAALGIAPHVVEAVLNHRSGTIKGVAAIYNKYNYAAEKRMALGAWGRYLDKLISGAPAGNVVDLAARR